MLASVSVLIGLRYMLTRRRSRSVSFIAAIAMTGIVLAVALLITVLSVMNGFDRELKQRILSIMPQVTLYYPQHSGSGELASWPVLRRQVLQMDGAVAATPFVEFQAMLYQGKGTQPTLVYGLDRQYASTVSSIGRYLQQGTLEKINRNKYTIALGQGLAAKLDVGLNDVITVIVPKTAPESSAAGGKPSSSKRPPTIRRLTVVDIFNTGTELDHSLSLLGLKSAGELHGSPLAVSGLHIKVEDLFAAPQLASTLQAQLPFGFYSSDWTRTHGNIYYAIRLSKSLVSLLLLLIIAIAAFNVISTLVMVVVDKQKDIAILKTLGMHRNQVTAIFMVQGTIIGVIGTLLGLLLGLVLALSIESIIARLESWFNVTFLHSDIYPVSFLPSSLQLNDVVLVCAISLVMSLLATIYPARKAAALQPAEVLRYDY